jgi:predicted DNA-binding protein (MmcQ/YjbR family)
VRRISRDDVLRYCEERPGAVEEYPFGDGVAVFKVGGKMFALVNLDGSDGFVNLKCDPDLALELRDRLPAVRPGYHADKRHWNTVDLDVALDPDDLLEMIDHSYEVVVAGLTKKARAALGLDATERSDAS